MPTTKLTGTFIRSGSIPTTALGGGVISSSVQLTNTLPVGTVSSSAQIDYNAITNKLSGVVSSSTQVTPLLPVGTLSSSAQVDYNNITNKLSDVVSASAQVQPLLPGGTVSSSAQYPGWVTASSQIDYNSITNKLSGVISSSTQFNALTGTSASFAATASFVNTLLQTVSASGNIEATINLVSNNSTGDEGGQIELARPQTNNSISGSVVIDVYQNRVRIFEKNSPNRGGYYDITSLASGVGTNLAGGGGTVTSITAGSGLTGGTITGVGTITVDTGSTHFSSGVVKSLPNGTVSSSTQQVVSTYTNATDNYVLTSTGAGGVNGESTLTYDGAVLAVSTNNAKYFQGGDDAALWDVNIANTIGVYGVQNTTVGGIKLGSSGPVIYGSSSGFVGIGTIVPSASLHVSGTMMIQGVIERANITGSAPPTTLNVDAISGSVFYLSGSSANNWTVNFRGSAATSLNSIMYNGQSMTFAVLVNHASVGYRASAHQVDGVSITPRWQGGTVPSGSGTSTDIYSYTIIKLASASYNMFASQTKFA